MSLAVLDVGFAPFSPPSWALPHDPHHRPSSLIVEMPVAAANRDALLDHIRQHPPFHCPGLIRLTVKELTGLSTMVKNLPTPYKGVLGDAYQKAAETHAQPWYVVVLARFESDSPETSGETFHDWFHDTVRPHLTLGYPDDPERLMYVGRFTTIAAGDREHVYTTPDELAHFVRTPHANLQTVTVLNHVLVRQHDASPFNQAVTQLLTTAQVTFQPTHDPSRLGQPGTADNTFYRKPLSTEILMGYDAPDQRVPYLMHGIWESLWDHENSHIDSRFRQAASRLAPYIVGGPAEPFYRTLVQWHAISDPSFAPAPFQHT